MSTGLLYKEWRQNAWIFLFIIIAFIGSEAMTATNSVDMFNQNYKYYQSEEFQKANVDDQQLTPNEIKNDLSLTPYDFEGNLALFIYVFLFLGLKLTVFEKNKQMDYFTFGLPYSKKQIFWHKLLIPALLIFIAAPIIICLRFLYVYQQIPNVYLPSISDSGMYITSFLLLFLFSFTVAIAVGNLVGEIIAAGIVVLGSVMSFFYMFPGATTNLIVGFKAYLEGKSLVDVDGGAVMLFSALPTSFLSGSLIMGEFIVLVGLSILMLLIGWYAVKTASLENNGKFLMNNKLRMPILIIGSIYTTICLGGHYATFNYENLITTTQVVTLIIKMILIFIITAIAFWFLMYKWKTLKKS
ncbi:hypothetical protein HCB45_09460 [Listeria sp. FSL L7-0091]|uniref:ABC-2 family transporter protein n=1 Tax=Listeria farberi TaxID=2713500 RepID=A0A7X1DDZ3_9LIST|nr:hypothetical protein [Listeria farberi]MBC1375147.1 hypothetical protein [Listeria farberi]MBC1381864.1 hypothetical protein [Listeria farberi]MBC2261809.1 hypothetical protein [Listeria farberi]MBC2268405.1 hypothetical protein [Listeria farberi]MBC2287165.1 hypothetical protein [Listeria farberi]